MTKLGRESSGCKDHVHFPHTLLASSSGFEVAGVSVPVFFACVCLAYTSLNQVVICSRRLNKNI